AVHEIRPRRLTLGHTKANAERRSRGDAAIDLVDGETRAAAIITERVARGLGDFAPLLELRGRAEAAVRFARVEQTPRVGLMAREIRALKADVFLPQEPKPLEPLEDGARAFVGAARAVGVLDAKQELSAVFADPQPVEERGSRAANVEVAGGG